MNAEIRNKLYMVAQKAVQNMIRHERQDAAPDCLGPFYQPKRPDMNKMPSK